MTESSTINYGNRLKIAIVSNLLKSSIFGNMQLRPKWKEKRLCSWPIFWIRAMEAAQFLHLWHSRVQNTKIHALEKMRFDQRKSIIHHFFIVGINHDTPQILSHTLNKSCVHEFNAKKKNYKVTVLWKCWNTEMFFLVKKNSLKVGKKCK
jgi:hypothetical protein